MMKEMIVYAAFIVFTGCYHYSPIKPTVDLEEQVKELESSDILRVETSHGAVHSLTAVSFQDSSLEGTRLLGVETGGEVSIPASDIRRVWVRNVHETKTLLFLGSIPVLTVTVIYLLRTLRN